jgi:hypothetical protein
LRSFRIRLVPLAIGAALSACGGSSPPPTLTAISLQRSGPTVAKGTTAVFLATGTYSDGTTSDVTSQATWTSSDTAVATIVGAGRAFGAGEGTATITAKLTGVTGSIVLGVDPARAVGMNVTPGTATIPKGLTQAFQATSFTMTDGTTAPVTVAVTWSTSNGSVASIDAVGVATGRGGGSVDVVATAAGVTGKATLAVGAPIPVSIAVSPTSAMVVRGGRQQYQAMGTMTDGSVQNVTASTAWSVGDSGISSILGPGLALGGPSGGSTVVTANLGTVTGSAALEVMPQRIAFVSSRKGTGNLASWLESGGASGAAGADAVCRGLASAARLPGSFVAWISDTNGDAWCRVQGLSGKRSSGCAGGAPTTAGPWIGMDGLPFAPVLEDLSTGKTILPLRLDETVRAVPDTTLVFTATLADGTLNAAGSPPCANWSSTIPPNGPMGGVIGSTDSYWTDYAGVDCAGTAAVACLEVAAGNGAALPPFTSGGKKVFVTSLSGTGILASWADAAGLAGIAAGDAICRAAATRAGLARASSFKAWLSDTGVNAIDRLTTDGPWTRVDGAPVAASKAALASGSLVATISVDENGRYVGGLNDPVWHWSVWTGTGERGLSNGRHCGDWKAGGGALGETGMATLATPEWSAFAFPSCDSWTAVLYCFED